MGNEFFCRKFREGDKEAVEKLVKSVFGGFLKGKFWNWKYRENPYFDSSLIAVAEANGEVIGCNHWLLRELKYSGSAMDKAVLAADVAVRPDYRGRGIGSRLLQFLRSSNIVKNRDAALIYMFTDPELAKKFYTPTAGYILARDGTAQYTKVLNWRKVKKNLERLNEEIRSGKFEKNLPKRGLKVLFKISAAPPLCICIKEHGLVADDGGDLKNDVDILISGDFSVFNRIKMSKRRKWSFLKALLIGKLKIKVKLTRLFSFFNALWIFEKVFSEKMT
jgi:predicted N-acetyltransferase YhbS